MFGVDSKSGHIFFSFPQHLDMLRMLQISVILLLNSLWYLMSVSIQNLMSLQFACRSVIAEMYV